MAFDIDACHVQLHLIMNDPVHIRWSDEEFGAALKQALGEISAAAGMILTIDGYEGATETTVPDILFSALISGAAGYLAAIRVGARADWETQSEGEPARLASWGSVRLAEFRRQVAAQYPNDTRLHSQRATTTPWGSWADDFGEVGKNDLD